MLAWNSPPTSLLYGDTVSATELAALATGVGGVRLAGTFTYTPGAGSILLQPGMQTFSVSFVPADAANYGTATTSVQIAVVYNTAVGHALLPPIARSPQDTAVFQLGAIVAVKFQLFFPDGRTRVATALGTIRVIRMATATSGLADEPVVAAAPSQGTTIRNVGDRYLFNLSTDNWTAGLHQVIVTLDDGSTMAGFVVVKSR